MSFTKSHKKWKTVVDVCTLTVNYSFSKAHSVFSIEIHILSPMILSRLSKGCTSYLRNSLREVVLQLIKCNSIWMSCNQSAFEFNGSFSRRKFIMHYSNSNFNINAILIASMDFRCLMTIIKLIKISTWSNHIITDHRVSIRTVVAKNIILPQANKQYNIISLPLKSCYFVKFCQKLTF